MHPTVVRVLAEALLCVVTAVATRTFTEAEASAYLNNLFDLYNRRNSGSLVNKNNLCYSQSARHSCTESVLSLAMST